MKKASIFLIFIFLIVVFSTTTALTEEAVSTISDESDLSFEDKLQEKVNLDYKNADIVSVLRSFAWTHKLNIVTSPEVKGKVTISLKDVPVEQALEAMLTINGLAYSIRDDIIYVSPGDVEMVELISEVIFLKYIAAADAQNLLRRVISTKGDMKIDELANSLIITDYPANIQKLEALLKKVDIPPRQILIEAKVVDITSSDLKHLGVTWNVEYAPGHGLFNRYTLTPEEADFTIQMPEQSTDLTGGQFLLNILDLKWIDITATVDALIRDGKANLLASPSIAVLNGQEARIIIGERYPIKERTQTTTGTTETTTFVDIGTTLKVTPQINADGYITMRVHPEVSSLAAALDAGPRITTREADTTVRIKEGETLVIGGLIKQEDNVSEEKIPWLGDLPVVGHVFSRSEHDIEQKELVVFITPTILLSREEMKKELDEKEIEDTEAYVTITEAGLLNAAEETFRKAQALDRGYGLVSRRKGRDFQKKQAATLYEHIYLQFPDSTRTPEALYSAGVIYCHYFKDHERAKRLFSQLISEYPDSRYARYARRKKKGLKRIIKHKKKRKQYKEGVSPVEEAEQVQPPAKMREPLPPLGRVKEPRPLDLDILSGK